MINSYGGITMDYQRHYDLLIEKAKQRTTDLYTERHHIVPQCLGGTDDQLNLVALTPEEHYVAHQLLVKMYPENRSLVHAAIMMIPANGLQNRNNKMYGWLRRKYQSVCKQRVGDKNGSYGRRWYHDPATLANGKFREDEIPEGWKLGRVPKTCDRFCKTCKIKVDTAPSHLTKEIYCSSCKKAERKERAKRGEKYDYEVIKKIYQEHKIGKMGYYTLAQKYGINKWSIYDYIGRYKEDLQKEFGV